MQNNTRPIDPDRHVAEALNPLIGSEAGHTIARCSALIHDLAQQIHDRDGHAGITAAHIMDTVHAALEWELWEMNEAKAAQAKGDDA
jgi:hypothetical protein